MMKGPMEKSKLMQHLWQVVVDLPSKVDCLGWCLMTPALSAKLLTEVMVQIHPEAILRNFCEFVV